MYFFVSMTILTIKQDRGRQRLATAAKLQASTVTVQDHDGNHNATERWVLYSIAKIIVPKPSFHLPCHQLNMLHHRAAPLYSRCRYIRMSTSRCHEP